MARRRSNDRSDEQDRLQAQGSHPALIGLARLLARIVAEEAQAGDPLASDVALPDPSKETKDAQERHRQDP
jgi:hypothetical protein